MREDLIKVCLTEIQAVAAASDYANEALTWLASHGIKCSRPGMAASWIEWEAEAYGLWEDAVEKRRLAIRALDRKLGGQGVSNSDRWDLLEALRQGKKMSVPA